MIYKILGRIFLSQDVISLGDELAKNNMSNVTVSERGTITVDGRIISSSKEFKALRQIASRAVGSNKGRRP